MFFMIIKLSTKNNTVNAEAGQLKLRLHFPVIVGTFVLMKKV